MPDYTNRDSLGDYKAFTPSYERRTAITGKSSSTSTKVNIEHDFERFNIEASLLATGSRSIHKGTLMLLLESCGVTKLKYWQDKLKNEFGLDVNKPPLTFPYDRYVEIAEGLRLALYSTQSPTVAYDEMGYKVGQAYFETMAGQVMKPLAKVLGPQKGAKLFLRTMSQALPWGTHNIEELTPNYLRYRKSLVGGPPPLMLGILRACLEVSGANLVSCSYTVLNEVRDDIVYEVKWL
jgi:uncharacterized protein (TIGR02265 family)